MLDYEINHYEVKVWYTDERTPVSYEFYQEEKAVEFIKLNRDAWCGFVMYQLRNAVIDF